MSDFYVGGNHHSPILSKSVPNESYNDLVSRHKAEAKELDDVIKALLKGAKKADRAQLEARAIQMRFDLRAKHQEEEDLNSDPTDADGNLNSIANHSTDNIKDNQSELEKIANKKAKAKKKQDKKKTKLDEIETTKSQIQAENSGSSLRDVELSAINSKLLKDSLEVKPVMSDGNCLYRAIADQLNFTRTNMDNHDHYSLRKVAAAYIRANADEFCPFLGFENTDIEFSMYCDRVASEVAAEWGGELELKALSCALQRTILIYSRDSPVLRMNESSSDPAPLRVTYHKHYYSLGEHYNSVQELVPSSRPGNVHQMTSLVSDMKLIEADS